MQTEQPSRPLTIEAWLSAYRAGARPAQLLGECLHRARTTSPAAVWIYLASNAELQRQLVMLEGMAGGFADIEQLLERYPLYGVPYAVKDNIDIVDVATTAACPAYSHIADRSAGVVRRLQAAGAIWMGKTNLDQFATGLVGTRSPYGQPASVFSAEHISGGSSSGSAVAVAAGLVAFALGTDTAGSGRVPAAFNQIVGLKPTPHRIGASGLVPACRTLDCISIFALSAGDAAHVLAVAEGPDSEDSFSRFVPGRADFYPGGALRVGVPASVKLDPSDGYGAPYKQAQQHARSLGCSIVPMDFTLLHRIADLLYQGPWVAERYAAVQALLTSQPEALEESVRAVIAQAERYSAADAFRAQYALQALKNEAQQLWDSVDVLMVPSTPGHPRFDAVKADPLGANTALGTYTNFVNLLGWCALALPAGTTDRGLPFGITLIAPANSDAALIALGREWEGALGLQMGMTGAVAGGTTGMRTGVAAKPGTGSTAGVRLRTPAVEASLPIAVVGAHLSGMPLNGQLLERGARLLYRTTTAPHYRLYALPGTRPPKPGLARSPAGGQAIDVEVWDMPLANVGSFLALIPPPLGLGSLELADGAWVHGFLCEAHALAAAEDISKFGGWRRYMQAHAASASRAEQMYSSFNR